MHLQVLEPSHLDYLSASKEQKTKKQAFNLIKGSNAKIQY